MKRVSILLILFLFFAATKVKAQQVSNLPTGRYETRFKNNQAKWTTGDLQLNQDGSYSVSAGKEAGEYKFSVAAQRVIFTSGPLKGMYATTSMFNQKPVIIFPATETQPIPLAGEVWAYYRQ